MTKYILIALLVFAKLCTHAQKHNAEILNQSTTIEVKNGKLFTHHFYQIQINNRAGEELCDISIPYSKMSPARNIKASVKDILGNTIKKLKSSQIITRSSIASFSLYEDEFVKEFTLRHNIYPYIIEYSYDEKYSQFIGIANWSPVLDVDIPTRNAELTITYPEDYKIKYSNQFLDQPTKIKSDTGSKTIKWTASYTELIKWESYAPPLRTLIPNVHIVPEEFLFETKGSFSSWKSFGNWKFSLLEDADILPESEKIIIHQLADTIQSAKEKIRILYHYLQDNTRYINVSIETGGLKPYPASYVAQNKYGDCKALSNYFKAVLKEVGIQAFYCTVWAGDEVIPVKKEFPSQQSNHIILYIPLKSEDIWLDCTSKAAFNYLGTFTQNREAFVVDENKSRYVKTQILEPNDVEEKRSIDIAYKITDASLTFRNTYKGNMYESLLHLTKNYNEKEQEKAIMNYFDNNGCEVNSYEFMEHNRDSTKIELKYSATSKAIFKHYGTDILIKNMEFQLPQITKPKDRKLPILLDYPVYKTDSITYEIPSGYKIESILPDCNIDSKYGSYTYKIKTRNDKILITKSFLLNSGNYPHDEYPDYYEFYQQVVNNESKTPVTLIQKQ